MFAVRKPHGKEIFPPKAAVNIVISDNANNRPYAQVSDFTILWSHDDEEFMDDQITTIDEDNI